MQEENENSLEDSEIVKTKLSEWLDKMGLSTRRFCDIYRCASEVSINNYAKRGVVPPKWVAKKIVKATKGEVTMEDLGVKNE